MKEKSNEATPLRPKGDRLLNAPVIDLDLNQQIKDIKAEETWKNSDRNSITLFKSETMRVVLIGMHKNSLLKTHKTKAYITVHNLKGKIKLKTDEQEFILKEGHMAALQPDVPHSVYAEKESFFLLSLAFSK